MTELQDFFEKYLTFDYNLTFDDKINETEDNQLSFGDDCTIKPSFSKLKNHTNEEVIEHRLCKYKSNIRITEQRQIIKEKEQTEPGNANTINNILQMQDQIEAQQIINEKLKDPKKINQIFSSDENQQSISDIIPIIQNILQVPLEQKNDDGALKIIKETLQYSLDQYSKNQNQNGE